MTTGKGGIGGGGGGGLNDLGVVGQLVWIPVDNPTPGDTVAVAGATYEFDGPGGGAEIPITIGDTLADTLTTLANQINAGIGNILAIAVDGPALTIFTADGPGGNFAPAANPVVSASEVADVWITVADGRAPNRRQATGRVVFTDVSVAESFAVWLAPGFNPSFVDWRLYTAAGEQIADTTLSVQAGSDDGDNAVTIDPTAGDTPPSAGDALIFTAYE